MAEAGRFNTVFEVLGAGYGVKLTAPEHVAIFVELGWRSPT
jgi:hypothetical protein